MYNNERNNFVYDSLLSTGQANRTEYDLNYLQEEFEDTKGVIRIRKSKNRQHNDQKKNDKQ